MKTNPNSDVERGLLRFGPARTLAAALCVVAWGCSDSNPTTPAADVVDPAFGVVGGSNSIVVVLQGTAAGEVRDIDGVPMFCFDVDLIDPLHDKVVGTGSDCLDLGSIVGDPSIEGFAISNTTFFDLPGGSIKSRNRTTIQPVLDGSPGSTHTTGDLAVANNVLGGTGRFKGAEGVAQLFGSVNMSLFFSDGIIGFNCVFIISLD